MYTEDAFLTWACEHCDGRTALKGGIEAPESASSVEAREHDAWGPDWMSGPFSATMACGNCANPGVVLGEWSAVEAFDRTDYVSSAVQVRYHPKAALPAPRLILMPPNVPEAVGDHIQRAFRLFWGDVASCANAIRAALEAVLDDQRINKTKLERRKRKRLTLHQRINLFRAKDEHLGAALMAVKWIGNAGSHDAPLSRDALFDGFDIVEHVLEELYASPRKRV